MIEDPCRGAYSGQINQAAQLQLDSYWIQTYTGAQFNLWNPKPESILIEDIAWSLAHINRFSGHLAQPISVAIHSIAVASCCPEELKLAALLHDAHEAYLGDITTPVKHILKGLLPELENRLMAAIAAKFSIPFPTHPIVRVYDRVQFEIEARNFFKEDKFDSFGLPPEPLKGDLETYKGFKSSTPTDIAAHFQTLGLSWLKK